MLNIGPAEVLVILVVALLVLGPKKLPEAARQIGKAMTEFRRVTSGLQNEVRNVLDDHLESTPAVDPPPLGPAMTNGDTPTAVPPAPPSAAPPVPPAAPTEPPRTPPE